MIIKNVIVYTEDKKFTAGGIVVHDDKIESIYTTENVPDMLGEEVVDGQGAYAIPGLIDLHFHGCMGDDFCDNSKEAIENIAKYEASVGVTTIAPATMTLPVEELEDILRTAAEYKKEQTIKGYEKKIKLYIKPELGAYRIKSINKDNLQAFITDLYNDGFSVNTVTSIKGLLTKSFNFAVDRNYIPASPAVNLVIPKNKQPDRPTRFKQHIFLEKD